jgi:tetratricopeptide (TPR) repeat protein
MEFDPSALNGFIERRDQAVRAVDSLLLRKARNVMPSLRPNHAARLVAWRLALRDEDGVLVRYTFEEFARLTPLEQYIEQVRADAEATLVHEQMGYVLLNDSERDDLAIRALGILPSDEASRFAEIASLHDVSPKHILVSPEHFLTGIRAIETNYGTASALAYGLLLIVGVRSKSEMIKYGAMLQILFDRITLMPVVVQLLNRLGGKDLRHAPFDAQFTILTHMHEQLLSFRSGRLGIEFRLNRVLEAALDHSNSEPPNLLGRIALDAVMAAKLSFPVKLVTVDNLLSLEVHLGHMRIYWESARNEPLSHVAVQPGAKTDILDLFPRMHHEIGVWYSRQGQLTRAIHAFKDALALKPDLPETHYELAQVYLRGNQPNEAIEASRQAVALSPDFAEAFVTLGSAYLVRNLSDEAIEALKTAIRLKPNLAEAFNNLGFAYQQKNELDKSIVAFQAATRLRPDYAQAHYNLGNVYLAANRVKPAIAAYQRTVRVNPSFVRAYYNLGQAFYQENRLDEAIEAYRKVLQINPKHAGALYNLGLVYRDKGMKEKAVEIIEQAVKLNPNLLR